MKAIIDKKGMLWHEQGGRRWPVLCPHVVLWQNTLSDGDTHYYHATCGDWCSLWREITAQQRVVTKPMLAPGNIIPETTTEQHEVRTVELWFERYDCRGHFHRYTAYEDQREVSDEG